MLCLRLRCSMAPCFQYIVLAAWQGGLITVKAPYDVRLGFLGLGVSGDLLKVNLHPLTLLQHCLPPYLMPLSPQPMLCGRFTLSLSWAGGQNGSRASWLLSCWAAC